jgi:hypothetical protein
MFLDLHLELSTSTLVARYPLSKLVNESLLLNQSPLLISLSILLLAISLSEISLMLFNKSFEFPNF